MQQDGKIDAQAPCYGYSRRAFAGIAHIAYFFYIQFKNLQYMLLNDYTDKTFYPTTKTKPLGAKKLRLPKAAFTLKACICMHTFACVTALLLAFSCSN